MAHYALINDSNVVVQVIVGSSDDQEADYAEIFGLTCKRTSYNTYGGVHSTGGTPFRKNYAGIGYSYDEARDAFIPPKTYESWLLNETTCLWEPPTPMPTSGFYHWNEDLMSWELVGPSASVSPSESVSPSASISESVSPSSSISESVSPSSSISESVSPSPSEEDT